MDIKILRNETTADLFAAIANECIEAANAWDDEPDCGKLVGLCNRAEKAARAENLDDLIAAIDDGLVISGGPLLGDDAVRMVAELRRRDDADTELREAVETFECTDEDDGDDEIADARNAVMKAAAEASAEGRMRAFKALGWDGLRG